MYWHEDGQKVRRLLAYAAIAIAMCLGALAPNRVMAETIKIGVTKLPQNGPAFIASDKGYFAAENLNAMFVYFDSGEPTVAATTSGDVDFGFTATSGALFNLGGQGALRIIAGTQREAPSFHDLGIVASNRAYAAGLTSYTNLSGKSVAVTQIGSPPHYGLGLLAEKYSFDLKSVRILPLPSMSNEVAALTGGQADAGLIPAALAAAAVQRGDMKLLGWMGDEARWQFSVIITSTKNASNRNDVAERFLRAIRRAAHDYHDAFSTPDERREDRATASEVLAIIAKYINQPVEQVRQAIPYVDADLRLDTADILHQIAWYKSQNMVKSEVKGDSIIDKKYVVRLTTE